MSKSGTITSIDEDFFKKLLHSTDPDIFIKASDRILLNSIEKKDELMGLDTATFAYIFAIAAFLEAKAARLLVKKLLHIIRI